jgi:hypothetical protein
MPPTDGRHEDGRMMTGREDAWFEHPGSDRTVG